MDGEDYFDKRDCPNYPLDVDDLLGKDRLVQRRICALGRKYTAAYKELEEAGEALGYYAKPLPFLRFPREIRDQIFTYALQAPLPVRTPPLPSLYTNISVFKPPTPSMLLVNTQVYREAKEVLYSRNAFAFSEPQHMLDFLEQIGNGNKDRIQSISFVIRYPPQHSHVYPSYETGIEPHGWAKALTDADFKNITKMHIEGATVFLPPSYMLDMDPITENAIKKVLQRNPGNGAIRKLKLTGYNCNAYKKFPRTWEIITKQWDESDDEELGTDEDYVEEESNDEEWSTDGGTVVEEESDVDSDLP